MKKLIILSAIAFSTLLVKQADAQIGFRVNLHFGTRPVYAPAPAPAVVVDDDQYYNDDDFYYLPDAEAYYDVTSNRYYYQDGDRWIYAASLPGRYHDFDWRSARRVEIRGRRPYMQHDAYRSRYGGFSAGASYNYHNDAYSRPHEQDYRRDEQHYDYRNMDRGYNRDNDHRDNQYRDNQYREQDRHNQPEQNRGDQGGYNQQRGQGGNYNQPYNQNGGGQPNNQQRGQGGSYNQPSNQNGGGNGQQRGQGGSYNQPANQNGGGQPTNQDHGGDRGGNGQHFSQTSNGMGVVNDRSVGFARPVRN